MTYRLFRKLYNWITRRRVRKAARLVHDLSGGDTGAAIAHHVGELMTLTEIEATRTGDVVESVVIWPDESEGYHYQVEYRDVEVSL